MVAQTVLPEPSERETYSFRGARHPFGSTIFSRKKAEAESSIFSPGARHHARKCAETKTDRQGDPSEGTKG